MPGADRTSAERQRRWRERRRSAGLGTHPYEKGGHGGYRGFIGFDGEGTTVDGIHRYMLLCAADEGDREWICRGYPGGLSTERCLDFLVNEVPQAGLKVGFSLGYDWTKILQDVDRDALWLLVHPEARLSADGHPRPVYWRRWKLNAQGSRMTITDTVTERHLTAWDVFRFFQSSFLNALALWQVTGPEELEFIARMKEARHDFASGDWSDGGEIERYCLRECHLLAQMMSEVREATTAAGLPLKQWHGAGSIASAMLKKANVIAHVAEHPEKVDRHVKEAYFGGRFECSRIGVIPETVHGYDINSAYPRALLDLPELHGTWRRGPSARRRLVQLDPRESHVVVCVEWDVRDRNGRAPAWGPFPVRLKNGTIIYPARGEGSYWLDELQAAWRLFGERSISVKDSWQFHPDNPEIRPHADIAHWYQLRKQWGKNGRGLVAKLGMNARYGKAAQRVGRPQWSSLVWAGIVTGRCRAQLLDAMAKADDLTSVLMLATDGLWSTEPLDLDVGDQLGQWDHTVYEGGVFLARPGVYFPLDASSREESWEKVVKARGISRRLLKDHADDMVRAWQQGAEGLVLHQQRFVGIRSGLNGPDPEDIVLPDPYEPPDTWPGLRRYILARGGLAAGDWSPDLVPRSIYRVEGVAPDVLAAEMPAECMEARGLWQPEDGSDAMLDALLREWGRHQVAVRTRVPKLILGQWIENQPVCLSFDPAPKRIAGADRSRPLVESDHVWQSQPYDPNVVSPEAASMRAELLAYLEQPDGFEVVEVAGLEGAPF